MLGGSCTCPPTSSYRPSSIAVSAIPNLIHRSVTVHIRALIFVAHSLGGLVVKQALIESSKQARDGRDRNLHKTCHAVMFFGTPP